MTTPASIAEQQAVEYGTYVACVDIFFDGARAYNIGHPVPVSNVEQHGYLDKGWVREVGAESDDKPAAAPAPDVDTAEDPTPAITENPAPQGDPIVVDPTQEES